jgi:copper chaperone CopZ
MKKVFKIDIDCANCAAKVEEAVKKLPNVNSVTVNYITQKMTLDVVDEKFDETLKTLEKTAKKIEPDFEIYK